MLKKYKITVMEVFEGEQFEPVFIHNDTKEELSEYDFRHLTPVELKQNYTRNERSTGVANVVDGPVVLEQIKSDLEVADLALYLNRK